MRNSAWNSRKPPGFALAESSCSEVPSPAKQLPAQVILLLLCRQILTPESAFFSVSVTRCVSLRHFGRRLLVLVALAGHDVAARAADLPSLAARPPAVAPAADFDWTGFYVGGTAGLGNDHFGFKYAVTAPGAAFSGTSGIDSFGPIVSLEVGFNYQIPMGFIPGGFVVGLEFDDSWTGIHGSTSGSGVPPTAQGAATFGARFLDVATGRLRLGYAIGQVLVYATGGFAFGVMKTSYNLDTASGFFASSSRVSSRSGVPGHVGALGGGIEYAVAPNWTVKAEYIYDGIRARYEVFNPVPGAMVGFGTRTMYHVARVGLNYKFDWFQPPVASLH